MRCPICQELMDVAEPITTIIPLWPDGYEIHHVRRKGACNCGFVRSDSICFPDEREIAHFELRCSEGYQPHKRSRQPTNDHRRFLLIPCPCPLCSTPLLALEAQTNSRFVRHERIDECVREIVLIQFVQRASRCACGLVRHEEALMPKENQLRYFGVQLREDEILAT